MRRIRQQYTCYDRMNGACCHNYMLCEQLVHEHTTLLTKPNSKLLNYRKLWNFTTNHSLSLQRIGLPSCWICKGRKLQPIFWWFRSAYRFLNRNLRKNQRFRNNLNKSKNLSKQKEFTVLKLFITICIFQNENFLYNFNQIFICSSDNLSVSVFHSQSFCSISMYRLYFFLQRWKQQYR